MEEISRSKRLKQAFVPGIIKENPLFVSMLGMCPALAVTKNVESALGMGVLFIFVLVCSNVLVSLLRNLIQEEIRTPCFIVIIATFVTLVKMFANAFLPDLYNSLGVFLSLLVVNCIILGRSEAYASSHTPLESLMDGLGNGIGFTMAIVIIALIREILGTGMITFCKVLTFLPTVQIPILKYVKDYVTVYDYSISIFQTPAGAFIVMGVILAVLQAHKLRKEHHARVDKRIAEAKKKEELVK